MEQKTADVCALQADIRNAIRCSSDPMTQAAAEAALEKILEQYTSACQKIEGLTEAKGKLGDFHIVTQYSGDTSRFRETVAGDAAHMRILVDDHDGNIREVYRGVEFSEPEIPDDTRHVHGAPLF